MFNFSKILKYSFILLTAFTASRCATEPEGNEKSALEETPSDRHPQIQESEQGKDLNQEPENQDAKEADAKKESLAPGVSKLTVKVNDRDRSFYFFLPESYESKAEDPAMIIFFHGLGEYYNAEIAMLSYGLLKEANDKNVIMVFPEGTKIPKQKSNPLNALIKVDGNLSWNIGDNQIESFRVKDDDLAFVKALLRKVNTLVAVDKNRIFAAGESMGAMFAYKLGCDMSETFAAIVAINGSVPAGNCKPKSPVSLLAINGTLDPNVPFNGGANKKHPGFLMRSQEESFSLFLNANKCTRDGSETTIDIADDGTSVLRSAYSQCDGSAQMESLIVQNGGHTYPGGYDFYIPESYKPETNPKLFSVAKSPLFAMMAKKTLGKTTKDISATSYLFEFLKSQKKK